MDPIFDVVIVGGGIVGLTAALALVKRDFSVAILDAQGFQFSAKPDTRVYAINQASKNLLSSLGVWEKMDAEVISPYKHMHVWDQGNQNYIDFDAKLIANSSLGCIIEERVIKEALLKVLENESNIFYFAKYKPKDIQTESSYVKISTEQKNIVARLLIIADGKDSTCRSLLHIPTFSKPYNQQAMVATVETEKAHQQTAYQIFNKEGTLAFLPLIDAKTCSIVWSTSPSQADFLMHLEELEFNAELTKAFEQKLGKVKLKSKRYQFPLSMQHTQNYVGQNWLLMGDAAHTIHPLAGLGLNIGLADVSAWIEQLDKSSNKIITNRMLNAYQRERKYEVWQVIALMQGFKTLFSNTFPPIVALRGIGLQCCNSINPIKRLFIEHAAGLRPN
jgi:2-octaprenylphenol hydroxylase